MGRFKAVYEDYIIGIGINQSPIDDISIEEYEMLKAKFRSRPDAPDGYRYMLRADTLEWDLVEIPPEPEDNPIEPEDAEEETND